MAARFRIRTSQGQEISFASHEMFAEFVRSGDLSPDDVVYDAETREWSSALTHPVVLQIELDAEEEAETVAADTGAEETADEAAASAEASGTADVAVDDLAPATTPSAEIGLDLAPAPDQLSPDEQAAAFVKRMQAERASERDFDDEPELGGFKMEQGSSGLLDDFAIVEEEPAAPSPTPQRRAARPERPSREERRGAPRREAQSSRAAAPAPPKKKKKKKKKGSGFVRRYAPLLIVGAVVAAAGVYFGPELLGTGPVEAPPTTTNSAPVPPPPPPLIPDTEEALRERAQERYLTSTRALLRDLPPIPGSWLSGQYLAAPSEYPEVRAAWNEVLALVRRVRAGDNERYRAGYLRALEDARVDGSSRTLRLAGAVAEFQGRVAPRAAHYDRVEALATAALRGHDALVEAEGTIAYEPAATTPVSGDPVIEAVGRSSDAQALLNEVLDLVLAELRQPRGPGRAENLGEWIWDGILGAVAR